MWKPKRAGDDRRVYSHLSAEGEIRISECQNRAEWNVIRRSDVCVLTLCFVDNFLHLLTSTAIGEGTTFHQFGSNENESGLLGSIGYIFGTVVCVGAEGEEMETFLSNDNCIFVMNR